MQRYLLCFSYDGTSFQGYQIQDDARTVQQSLEQALIPFEKKHKIKVTGAGRTDSGVHALKQYASFDLDTEIPPDRLTKAINTRLPADIRSIQAWKVDNDFSARYNAVSRSYIYRLTNSRTPFNKNYAAFLPRMKYTVDIVKDCLPFFLGKHDFSSFAKHNPQLKHHFCDLQRFELEIDNEDFVFHIKANRFLHNMVRRMVGTSLNISSIKEKPSIIKELLAAKNPASSLIYTAPPEGLYLAEVEYPELKQTP